MIDALREDPELLLQALVAGIVAAGLLVAWVVAYLRPILMRTTELQRLDSEISERRLEKARLESERELDKEKLKVAELREQLDRSSERVARSEFELAERFGDLSDRTDLPAEERREYAERSAEARERAGRWQDEEFLFDGARAVLNLSSGEVSQFALPETVLRDLQLNDFAENGDRALQEIRLNYVRTVLVLLGKRIDHEIAIAVWLAGVDAHNTALSVPAGDPENVRRHFEEIEAVYQVLARRVRELPRNETTGQILSWLDIHRHNMRVMRE